MSAYGSDIKLGDRYRDDQTGIEGVATSIHFYQHACERITLELVKADGELQELTFDAPRLRSLTTQKVAKTTKTGGPARAGESRSHERRSR